MVRTPISAILLFTIVPLSSSSLDISLPLLSSSLPQHLLPSSIPRHPPPFPGTAGAGEPPPPGACASASRRRSGQALVGRVGEPLCAARRKGRGLAIHRRLAPARARAPTAAWHGKPRPGSSGARRQAGEPLCAARRKGRGRSPSCGPARARPASRSPARGLGCSPPCAARRKGRRRPPPCGPARARPANRSQARGMGRLPPWQGRASNGEGRRVFVCEFLFRAIVLVNFCVM
ncbi:hypothetical protein PVAP13_6KG016901 [Panicum virgatum]|uniref:Uncharacterized protein n=1 Tax=Panicum virgatum TaxID=38727 RepID=A0A8T0R6I9_PANVG|nr:hypothetical protein PVAP13_6KG016901 [Panicum virgatum]